MGHDLRRIDSMMRSLQFNAEGVLSLLGGDDDDRELFLERWKGITTPAEFRVITSTIDVMTHQLQGVQQQLNALDELAGGIQERG